MRDGGRLAAAIEVLTDVEQRHKPARLALKAWGDGARYAGSRDRAFVSGLVLDALRRRRSTAWAMGEDSPRAAVLGVLRLVWGWPADRIVEAAADEHGIGGLSPAERRALAGSERAPAPAPVAGDYPDWADPLLARVFGDDRAAELAALAERAPVDLRANRLKTDPERAARALAPLRAEPAGVLPDAFRIAAPAAADRAGSVETIPQFGKGWFEVQDLGSQIAAACAGDIKGKQVLDFCAGGGGKTLALAAAMANTGQLYAHDSDARRMADIVPRAARAGVRNLQIRSPVEAESLKGLEGKMDLVFVDAPCTGSGVWRRHPDSKWRLSPEQLERRMAEQDRVLDQACAYVKPGGRLIYVTCSIFAEENEDRVAAFLERNAAFVSGLLPSPWRGEGPGMGVGSVQAETPASETSDGATPIPTLPPSRGKGSMLRLTPLSAGTDGFFVALLERTA
ncbi:MAG: RsmB/NOP family class I SAM-dependent RNA methyltransferase [Pseudomonadota bacterium]